METSKKAGNNGISLNANSVNPDERFLVDMFAQIAERLKQNYNYSNEEIHGLWNNDENLHVPVAIFAGKLSPAEALTKFLKEKLDLGYHEISELIGRNERSVWANYKRAVKKMPWPLEISNSILVPVHIFNSKTSILESLVSYLKEAKKMRNKKIAQVLNKNQSNIWTLYNRANKKMNNGHKNENL